MVQDRKEPTLSSIKPERDEIMTHQSRQGKRPPGGGGGARPPRPAPGRSVVGTFALALAFISLGAAGFAGWQLTQAQAGLTDAEDRIAELEARLNMTNTESDQSVSAIHDKLEWADSEIRKLWGVSYDTNRKAISTNKDDISKVANNASEALSTAKSAQQAAKSQQSTLNTVKTVNNEQQLVLTQLEDEMSSARQQLQQLNQQVKALQGKVATIDSLQKRVGTNEEAIEAIDAFRRSINADVQQLKQRLGTP